MMKIIIFKYISYLINQYKLTTIIKDGNII